MPCMCTGQVCVCEGHVCLHTRHAEDISCGFTQEERMCTHVLGIVQVQFRLPIELSHKTHTVCKLLFSWWIFFSQVDRLSRKYTNTYFEAFPGMGSQQTWRQACALATELAMFRVPGVSTQVGPIPRPNQPQVGVWLLVWEWDCSGVDAHLVPNLAWFQHRLFEIAALDASSAKTVLHLISISTVDCRLLARRKLWSENG